MSEFGAGLPSNVPNLDSFAECVGVARRTVNDWVQPGARIKPTFADQVAIGLGVHPLDIWPDEWNEYLADALERECRVCLEVKELSEDNYSPRSGRDGEYRYDCKDCERAATRARRARKRALC